MNKEPNGNAPVQRRVRRKTEGELLPCPFCGNAAYVAQEKSSDYDQHWHWYAECTGCGAEIMPYVDKATAIKKWNSRVHNAKLTRRDYGANINRDA